MTQEVKQTIAINQVGFDYFQNCINNGATPEEAKAEMMTERALQIIAERVRELLKK